MLEAYMALFMIIVVLVLILTKKIPMNFVMFVVPIVCGLLLGFSIKDLSSVIVSQFNSIMQSAGYLLLFGNIYFGMLNESGMFDVIINRLITLLGKRMNVVVIAMFTTVIGVIGYLTANFSTVYLLCFPLMLPLYKKFNFDKEAAFYICQTACVLVGFLPWGIGIAYTAAAAGLDSMELANASIPWGLCVIPTIILQWIYFSMRHKKIHGTLGIPSNYHSDEEISENSERLNARPKLFWINFIIFVIAMVGLMVFQLSGWLVFLLASIVTAMINYPKNFGEIWSKNANMFFNVVIMLLAISVYLAIFNAKPEGGISMIDGLAALLVNIVPSFMLRYMHLIFLMLCVVVIRFVPFQVFNAMYPLFIAVGASFGIPALAIIAPFVCNLTFATSVTPFNSATYVGCNLLKIDDVNHFCNRGVRVMSVSLLITIFVAFLAGLIIV
jgi:CitMHS family citrate-Mg2+:H+ or citrate-Ca2+:H+ symporter